MQKKKKKKKKAYSHWLKYGNEHEFRRERKLHFVHAKMKRTDLKVTIEVTKFSILRNQTSRLESILSRSIQLVLAIGEKESREEFEIFRACQLNRQGIHPSKAPKHNKRSRGNYKITPRDSITNPTISIYIPSFVYFIHM